MKVVAALAIIGGVALAPSLAAAKDDGAVREIARLASPGYAGSCPFNIVTSAAQTSGSQKLVFELVNRLDRPLQLRTADLPWSAPHSFVVAAVRADGRLIPGVWLPIDDFGEDPDVSLAAGARIQGEYDLGWRWSLDAARPTALPLDQDVLLVWAFRLFGQGPAEPAVSVCTGVTVLKAGKAGA